MKKIKLPGNVWRMVHDQQNHQLFVDIRNDQSQEIGKIDLTDRSLKRKTFDYPGQSELVGAQSGDLFFVNYTDANDPNEQEFFSLSWSNGSLKKEQQPYQGEDQLILPQIYLQGSDHHGTVARYLEMELPLSCEYLEWNSNVMISYYLRSGNKFERHLLILKNGLTKADLLQDSEMVGFSPGAFFVVSDLLVFIREQNEVCFYPD